MKRTSGVDATLKTIDMDAELNRLAESIQTALADTFRRVDLDGSKTAKNTEVDVTQDRPQGDYDVSLVAPDYIRYVDKGRRPGRKPPVKDILAWIKEKNIPTPNGITQESLAFAIATSIGRDGTRGKNFLSSLTREITSLIVEFTNKKLVQDIRETIKIKK